MGNFIKLLEIREIIWKLNNDGKTNFILSALVKGINDLLRQRVVTDEEVKEIEDSFKIQENEINLFK